MDDPTRSDEVKQQLLRELASMKRQSVFSLVLALLCVVGMVLLFLRLRETNRKLRNARERVDRQNDSLRVQGLALTNLKNELDAWRMSLLEVDSIPADVEPEPILVSEDIARAAESEVVIQRPSLLARARVSLGSSDKVPKASTGEEGPKATPAPPTAPRPMVVYKADAQSYGLRNERAPSRSICFGYIIYIQDRQKRQASAELQRLLKERGAVVPAIQSKNLPHSFGHSVKYFHREDEKAAQWVRQVLLGVLNRNGADVGATDIAIIHDTNARVSLGQLEVWVGD